MPIMNVPKFERFFRLAANLDMDKADLKRYSEWISQKIYDLLLRGQATAKANGRDIILFRDLPVTKGLQERIHDFRKLNEEMDLAPIRDALSAMPLLDLAYGDEVQAELPNLAGGSAWRSPAASKS